MLKTYCPWCLPEIGISSDGKFIIVREYPKHMFDLDNILVDTFDLKTGLHVRKYGWFKGLEPTEENMVEFETIHPYEDWLVKHMINESDVDKEIESIKEYI